MTEDMPPAPQTPDSPVAQAHALANQFARIVGIHKRLSAANIEEFEKGNTVRLVSGTEQRPVLELQLTRTSTSVSATVHVDPTLPPRMRAHAETLATTFRNSLTAERNS